MRFSVVMPTYNRGAIVGNAIQSILDQEFGDWELIIVDDGSTDNTEEVVKRFPDRRIRYFKIPHQNSKGKVRNYGNKQAKGEIIVVQDDDDLSFPNRLSTIDELFIDGADDLFYHSLLIKRFNPYFKTITQNIRWAKPVDKKRMLESQYISGVFAYTKKVAEETPYRESLEIFDDYIFIIDCIMKGYNFEYTDDVLYEYFMMEDSTSMRKDIFEQKEKALKETARIMKDEYNINASITFKEGTKLIHI